MPWEMWVYFGVGLLIAYWYQRREGNPEQEHHPRAQVLVLVVLAWIWPILLLAIAANRPDKPKDRPRQ